MWRSDGQHKDVTSIRYGPRERETARISRATPFGGAERRLLIRKLDFFALTPWDRAKVEKEFGLKEIYVGPVSGSALAVPQSSVAAR